MKLKSTGLYQVIGILSILILISISISIATAAPTAPQRTTLAELFTATW
jgi:hypothetical protein